MVYSLSVCREYADTAQHYSPSGYLTQLNNGITNGYAWYSITGGRQDFMNYFHHCREFTLELSITKKLPESQLEAHWNYNYRSFLNYIEQSLYGLRGTVSDSETGEPIWAKVYIEDHDSDSSFVYSAQPHGNYHRYLFAGNYNFTFIANGYHPKTVNNISIVNRQTTWLDVNLLPLENHTESLNANFPLKAYPNPVINRLIYIESDRTLESIEIYSFTGRMLKHASVTLKTASIDMSEFPKGVYLLKVRNKSGFAVKKVVLL